MIFEVGVPGSVTTDLRRSVLRPSWEPGTPMHGDRDPNVVHIAARPQADGSVVGACVLLPNPYPLRPHLPAWQLRGMAIAPDWERRGVGRGLLQQALSEVNARGTELLWCQARENAVGFYSRHGFAVEGEPFTHAETGIVHRFMVRPVREPFR